MTTVEHLYASHAPVFTVAGHHKGELARDCLRLDIGEDTAGLRTFVGHFHGIGPSSDGSAEQLQYLDGSTLDFGSELSVTLGPPGGERLLFEGTVSAIEASFAEGEPPTIAVFAEDELMALRTTRRMRTYSDVTDGDIARRIADDHGLTADVDADGPRYRWVQQWNQSDLAFLRERARRIQAEIWAQGRTLHFQTRSARPGAELTLVQGNHLIELQARADLAHQRTSVTVSGYDAGRRERIDETAGAEVVAAEVAGGRSGISVLEGAFGERPSFRVLDAPMAAGEAQAWAEGDLLRRARAFAVADGTTRGSPDLAVGSRITLERCGRPFDGDSWYATSVRHSWDLLDGHRTRFRAERATVAP